MQYETPEMLIFTLEEEDIIKTSTLIDGGIGGGDGTDFGGTNWTPLY